MDSDVVKSLNQLINFIDNAEESASVTNEHVAFICRNLLAFIIQQSKDINDVSKTASQVQGALLKLTSEDLSDEIDNVEEVLNFLKGIKDDETLLAKISEIFTEIRTLDNTTTGKLAEKVDKEFGKGLSSNDYTTVEKKKLAGIEAGANKYVHPATHPATMINEDAEHRFMTDAERKRLAGIEAGANKYVHPATHPATMINEDAEHRFMTDAEKAKWDAAAIPVLLPINGVCSGREEMPASGVWAFPDEEMGGMWCIEGDFSVYGLTRRDYCVSVGIDGSRWVPKPEGVYRCVDYKGVQRIYTVDPAEGKNRLVAMATVDELPVTHEIDLRSSHFDAQSLKFPTLLDWSMEELDKNIKVGDKVKLKCDFLQSEGSLPAGMWCEWVVTGKWYEFDDNTGVIFTGLVPSLDSIYKIEIYFETNAAYAQVNNTVHVQLTLLKEW